MNRLILLALICCSVCVQAQTGDLIDKVAAIVGNKTILLSDIENQVIQQSQGATVTHEMRCGMVEHLLFEKLLVNQAEIDSVEVSESEIQADIALRLEHFISMVGSEEAFVEYYGKSIAEWKEEFHDATRDRLVANKMQRQLMGQVDVTPAEVSELFESIPKDSLPLIGEQVHYSQLIIKPELDDAEKEKTRLLLDSIRDYVAEKGGVQMLIEASKWSEDPGSKDKGGCYPIQQRGTFVPEYEAAVFETPEGGYSEVFETAYGFHFVYVKKKLGNRYEACHILISPKLGIAEMEAARDQLDSLAGIINRGEMDFVKAVSKFSTDENTRNQEGRVINGMTGGTGHEIAQLQDPKLFLALNGLEEGQISTPVELSQPDGTTAWAILRLDRRVPAHTANLKDDYLIFKNEAEQIKRNDDLNEWVDKRLQSTYVRIDEEYLNCDYQFNWLGNGDASVEDN